MKNKTPDSPQLAEMFTKEHVLEQLTHVEASVSAEEIAAARKRIREVFEATDAVARASAICERELALTVNRPARDVLHEIKEALRLSPAKNVLALAVQNLSASMAPRDVPLGDGGGRRTVLRNAGDRPLRLQISLESGERAETEISGGRFVYVRKLSSEEVSP